MPQTETVVKLDLPPQGGSLSVVGSNSLEDDAHYLRVTLDKSENFKVAAGERLRDLLVSKFNNNRNALRDWYEESVAQGKAHRSWSVVDAYLGTVLKHGPEAAAAIFAERDKRAANATRNRLTRHREDARAYRDSQVSNKINGANPHPRPVKSEYDLRKEWISYMNVLWFKGDKEWQDRWLLDRELVRRPKY